MCFHGGRQCADALAGGPHGTAIAVDCRTAREEIVDMADTPRLWGSGAVQTLCMAGEQVNRQG